MKHRTPRRRAGSVYVFVLSTATLAAAAGTTAIILHGARLDRVELGAQAQRATEDAQSALEYAVATVSADPGGTTWRSSATLAFSDKKYFGAEASSVTITLTDPTDNDLADTNLDPVAVTVKAVLGPCEQSYEVTMGVAQTPMSCLDYALTVGGTLTKLGTGEVYTGGTISSGRAWETDSDPRPSVTSALSVVQAPASGDAPVTVLRRGGGGAPKGGGRTTTMTITSTTATTESTTATTSTASSTTSTTSSTGGSATGVPYDAALHDAVVPNSTDIFTHYGSIGTPISLASIPGATIENVVLSPGVNPFGATNAQGVYIIHCAGADIFVRDCRIAGTLILLDPGAGSEFSGSICIEPVNDALPALLVRGSLMLKTLASDLEESATGVSFNPASSGYDDDADTDNVDTYPSWFKGLVFVSMDLAVADHATVRGVVVVGGNLSIGDACELHVVYAKPEGIVPGFAQITGMAMTPGSLQRVVD